MINFNEIKHVLMSLAKMQGKGEDVIDELNKQLGNFDRNMDYSIDWQDEIENDFLLLKRSIDLHQKAMVNHDLLAAKSGLLMARIAAISISDFFHNMKDDFDLSLQSNEYFSWPQLPEGYAVPQEYSE